MAVVVVLEEVRKAWLHCLAAPRLFGALQVRATILLNSQCGYQRICLNCSPNDVLINKWEAAFCISFSFPMVPLYSSMWSV